MVLINARGQLGTVVSSARYKRDIQDMGVNSRGLLKLRPVTFRYKQDPQGARQYGLTAEEVAKVYPELVTRGTDGELESVQYHKLIPMLLNELQRQQQQIEVQSQEIAELSVQNTSLRAMLGRMQAREEEQREQRVAVATRLERLEEAARHQGLLRTTSAD
jgi:Chaperone of endosialidase